MPSSGERQEQDKQQHGSTVHPAEEALYVVGKASNITQEEEIFGDAAQPVPVLFRVL
jgi:hypothetical protein